MINLASRYAEALLTAAKRENALKVVTEEMKTLACEFSGSTKVFSAPVFPVREQLATVSSVLGDHFHPLTKRFVCLLVSMRRLGGIGRIAAAFDKLARREMGQIDLFFTVYEDPAPKMKAELIQAAGGKGLFNPDCRENIELHFEIDKTLLGGFVAECDGISWDCSLRSRLTEMSKVIRKI
jgi:ATP synthase F1 delta subunit